MAGILAIWNDCAPEGYDHFERWYIREHLQERVGVPGFRFGRRYETVSGGDRRFFAFYEVESPDVLSSKAYVERLEAPTPWTLETMKSFRNMVRTVCDLRAAAGDLIGSHAVVLRADGAMAPDAGGGQAGAKTGRRARRGAGAAVDGRGETDARRHRRDEKPRQGPARRRRLRRRMPAPRRCGSGRRDACKPAGRARRFRQRASSASMACCASTPSRADSARV